MKRNYSWDDLLLPPTQPHLPGTSHAGHLLLLHVLLILCLCHRVPLPPLHHPPPRLHNLQALKNMNSTLGEASEDCFFEKFPIRPEPPAQIIKTFLSMRNFGKFRSFFYLELLDGG